MPPGVEDVSFWGWEAFGGWESGGVVTFVVDGKKGSEKRWGVPGTAEEVWDGVLEVDVDGGGAVGAAFGVDGTVAMVRWY